MAETSGQARSGLMKVGLDQDSMYSVYAPGHSNLTPTLPTTINARNAVLARFLSSHEEYVVRSIIFKLAESSPS